VVKLLVIFRFENAFGTKVLELYEYWSYLNVLSVPVCFGCELDHRKLSFTCKLSLSSKSVINRLAMLKLNCYMYFCCFSFFCLLLYLCGVLSMCCCYRNQRHTGSSIYVTVNL